MKFLRDLLTVEPAFAKYAGKCTSCGTVTNIICSKCNNDTFRTKDGGCLKCGKCIDINHPSYSKCVRCGKKIIMRRKE